MTDLIRINLDNELVARAKVAAKRLGIKRHEFIESAIRSRLDGGDRLAGQSRPEEESALATQPSTPSQIDATPIEENSEKSNERSTQDWCKYGRKSDPGKHIWAWASDIERCDLCRLQRDIQATPLSLVTDLAEEMAL